MEMTRSEVIRRLRVLQARAERRRSAMGQVRRTIPARTATPGDSSAESHQRDSQPRELDPEVPIPRAAA